MIDPRQLLLMVAFAGLLMPAPAGAAEPAAAMVIKVTGDTVPSLSQGDEIPAGVAVRLAPNGELTFLHYLKCKLVAIDGGTVTLSRTDFTTDGKVASEKDGPCPRIHQLSGTAAGATSGALVMRGVAGVMRLPINPEIVFAGSRAAKVTGTAIYDADAPGRLVARLDLAARHATLPKAAPALTANARYLLRVAISDQPTPLELVFVGAAPTADGSLVVLRVD